MRDVASTLLPPATDLPHGRKQNLVQHTSQAEGLREGIQELADCFAESS